MIERLISNFGGLASMSKITGIPKTTIFSWKNKGRPPAWRIDYLKYCAENNGIKWIDFSDEKEKVMHEAVTADSFYTIQSEENNKTKEK